MLATQRPPSSIPNLCRSQLRFKSQDPLHTESHEAFDAETNQPNGPQSSSVQSEVHSSLGGSGTSGLLTSRALGRKRDSGRQRKHLSDSQTARQTAYIPASFGSVQLECSLVLLPLIVLVLSFLPSFASVSLQQATTKQRSCRI